jgi:hypothetical protein
MENEDNFIKEKITINMLWANIFGIIVLLIAILLFGVTFYSIWKEKFTDLQIINLITASYEQKIMFVKTRFVYILVLIPLVVAHELIHGVFFSIFVKNKFKSIKFGIMPAQKLFSPYCHCKEKIKINHYRIEIIMPLIVLGIIPTIISIIIGKTVLLFFGIILIACASGDILIFIKTLKEKNNIWIYDLPTDGGYYIYRNNI